MVRIHHLDHRAWLRRIINDCVVVFGVTWFMYGQTHQSVAICWGKVCAFEQLFDRETMKLRRHLRATAKNSGDADLFERDLLAQGLQKFWRRKQAPNVFMRSQQS